METGDEDTERGVEAPIGGVMVRGKWWCVVEISASQQQLREHWSGHTPSRVTG